jgi:hypothetical protein
MKIERQIEQIIEEKLPAIAMGEESLETVVAKYPQIAGELRPRLEAAWWLQQARFSLVT